MIGQQTMLVKKTLVLLSVMAATPSPLLCPLVLRVSEMRYAVSQVFGNRSSRQVGNQALLVAKDPLAVVILSPGSKARASFLSLAAFRLLYGYYGERERACGWYT